MSIFIENAEIFFNGKILRTNLVIDDGKIRDITDDRVTCTNYLDASGKIILPGLIDCHVHFRDPGMTHKEDFLSGSMAAAAGGVTSVIDMPNTLPATTTVKLLDEKRELAKKSVVNYGFHFGGVSNNLDDIKAARNIASVKVFLNESTGNLAINEKSVLKDIFSNTKRISVHAEGEKAKEAIEIIKETKNRLYLCHISSCQELAHLKKYLKGKIFAEVTPHHLFLTDQNDKDSFTKMKPALKTKEDQEALWKALGQGLIDTIGSDHAPHTSEEKRMENFPYGVPGVETTLPLLLNAVNEKRLSLARVVEMCCENPARIFGINEKGSIRVGYDADLVLVDMKLVKEISNETLFTKCKWSPFNGWKLKGWPVTTIVNGTVVFDSGKILGAKGKELNFMN